MHPRLDGTQEGGANTSPAAERMRRHRQRRQKGLTCLTVELRLTEVDALISRNLLAGDDRGDCGKVREALYRFLDSALGGSMGAQLRVTCLL